MYIHSYFTDGFYPWAQLFLESLALHNGDKIPVKLDAINLKQSQIDYLHNVYGNLEINGHNLDLKQIAHDYNIKLNDLLRQKEQIETKFITKDSKNWKQLIGEDFRIEATQDMLKRYPGETMLHFDIDTYVRADITPLIELVENNDICVRFRLNSKKDFRKTLIAVQSYKQNDVTMEFFDRWIEIIREKKLNDRPIAWGQWAHYLAYLEFKDKCKWGDVPEEWYAPRHLPEHKIWGGNTTAGKTANAKTYREDMEKLAGDIWK